MVGERTSLPAFVAVSTAVFAAGVAAMALAGTSMSAMAGTPMPGGWMLAGTWTPMCGQTWPALAWGFLTMWTAMTAAMMSPSFAPTLWRWRQAVGRTGAPSPDRLAALAGLGYFAAWALIGAAIFPLGATLAAAELRWPELARAAPAASGLVVLGAGLAQFTPWKARRLACCRTPACHAATSPGGALRRGLALGLDCGACCAGPTAALLVVGMMDLWAMAAVTLAITLERLAPGGMRFARASGVVAVVAGLAMVARAIA